MTEKYVPPATVRQSQDLKKQGRGEVCCQGPEGEEQDSSQKDHGWRSKVILSLTIEKHEGLFTTRKHVFFFLPQSYLLATPACVEDGSDIHGSNTRTSLKAMNFLSRQAHFSSICIPSRLLYTIENAAGYYGDRGKKKAVQYYSLSFMPPQLQFTLGNKE